LHAESPLSHHEPSFRAAAVHFWEISANDRLIDLVEGDIDNAFEIVKKEDDRGCRVANAEYLRLHPELSV
jgi:hypothetical protein